MQKEGSLCNLNDDDDASTQKLSLRGKKIKIYLFIINTISILMVGRIMAGIKYDSEKQFKFKLYQYIIM
jgi:hypothetical protein